MIRIAITAAACHAICSTLPEERLGGRWRCLAAL
jgi:hypothetical protein